MNDDETLDFETLVREHQAGLRAFIRALGADEAWVDDLAQEVFLVAYRKRADFRTEADFGKWLRGIARRHVAGERVKSARRRRILHEGVSDILIELGNEEIHENPRLKTMTLAMRGCVEALPEHQSSLLRMRYEDGRQAKDLATTLACSAENARKKLQRVRETVRRCVERKLQEAL